MQHSPLKPNQDTTSYNSKSVGSPFVTERLAVDPSHHHSVMAKNTVVNSYPNTISRPTGNSTYPSRVAMTPPRSGYVAGDIYNPPATSMVYADRPNVMSQHYQYDMNAVPSFQKGLIWTDSSIVKQQSAAMIVTSSSSSSSHKGAAPKKKKMSCCSCRKSKK